MNKKILIIEDELLIGDALLKKFIGEGFEVELARDGEAGLKKAKSFEPQLILLDLILPKMDGMSVMRELRSSKWGKGIEIIVLTNLDSGENVAESRAHGVTDYLVKTDWRLDDLVVKVKDKLK